MQRASPAALPLDTSLDAARVDLEALRHVGGVRRAQMAFELSEDLRGRLAAGVRHRHPEYDEAQVRLAVIRLWLGEELFRLAHPAIGIEP